jgi:hypothetical protein
MQKKAKVGGDYLKRAVLTFLWLLIVFVCVMESFCLSISSDIAGCFLVSLLYFYPSMWLSLFIILELFKSRKFFLTKKRAALLLILAIFYVVTIEVLSFIEIIDVDDFEFAGIIISIWLISFISFRLFLNQPWRLDTTT